MPEYDFIVGFDFGHGETSVAVVEVDKVSVNDGYVPVEDIYICEHSHEPKITSLVGYDCNDNPEVDIDIYDFKGFERIESYFKGPLVDSENFKAISEEQKEYFKDFIITVFNRIVSNPKNVKLIGKNIKYYAACPSGWNKEQKDSYLSFLQNECKLPIDGIIEESRAAHVIGRKKLYERNPELAGNVNRIAVLDLGSSTLDITLHSDKTYTDGYETGASYIEEALLRHFINSDKKFEEYYNKYLSFYPSGKDDILLFIRYAKEEFFNKKKKYPTQDKDLICTINWGELSLDKFDGVSILKIKGSEFISLYIKGENKDSDNNSYEDTLKKNINDFISKYGKADAIVLTGGASQMDFYKDIAIECFEINENACIVDNSPSYSISQGVAVIGYMDLKCKVIGDSKQKKLPPELQMIIDQLPDIINGDILRHYKEAYIDSLYKVVDEWKSKSGKKTLEELISNFDTSLNYLKNKTEDISKKINISVAENLGKKLNNALKDTIRLYFGFDAPLQKFEIDYTFNFAVPEEDNRQLYLRIVKLVENYINNRSVLHRWNGKKSLEKDRSGDADLLNKLPQLIKAYIDRWYSRYNIGDSINEEISDCKDRFCKFYASTIKNISCQI